MDGFRDAAPRPLDGLVVWGKVLPGWAVRLVVIALLLPPLVLVVDAAARLRRRREPVGRWVAWTLAGGLPLVLACLVAVLLAAMGLIAIAPAAPIPPSALKVGADAIVAMVALVVVTAFGWVVLRPALLRRRGEPAMSSCGNTVSATSAATRCVSERSKKPSSCCAAASDSFLKLFHRGKRDAMRCMSIEGVRFCFEKGWRPALRKHRSF